MSDTRENRGPTAVSAGGYGSGGYRFAGLLAMAGAAALAGVLSLGAVGCVKQHPTMTPKPPPVKFNPTTAQAEPDLDARVRELHAQSADLSTVTHSLPGATPAENRDKVRRAFTLLTQILPRLEMVPTGGEFDHQVTIVELTRSTLATASPDLSIGPVVDRGLRATYNALDRAQHGRYYDQDTRLRGTLDQLSAKRDDLDRTQGAEHDLVWADMFNLASDAISQMVGILSDRLTGGPATTQETAPGTPGTPALPTPPTTAPAEGGTPPASPTTRTTPTTPTAPATAPAETPATSTPATAPAEAGPTTAPIAAPTTAPPGAP